MDTQAFTEQHLRHERVSWAGIWAGLFAGLGVQIMLTALGFGIGLTSSGSSATDYIIHLPRGVELWSGLVWLFSAFLGRYVSAWMSGSYSRSVGVFHGFVTWGIMMTVLFGTAIVLTELMRLTIHMTTPMTPLLKAAAWWVFVSGIISLGCAYLGGRIGVRAAEHSLEEKWAQRAA
ncbi:MAG TPA: hypothetical protein VE222_00980 [Nitrospiraceae bacterium]|nr:hypothetical protein [Nitrospiraceae bacterium]